MIGGDNEKFEVYSVQKRGFRVFFFIRAGPLFQRENVDTEGRGMELDQVLVRAVSTRRTFPSGVVFDQRVPICVGHLRGVGDFDLRARGAQLVQGGPGALPQGGFQRQPLKPKTRQTPYQFSLNPLREDPKKNPKPRFKGV